MTVAKMPVPIHREATAPYLLHYDRSEDACPDPSGSYGLKVKL
ncbi:MAG: hypothetical protein QF551_01335 [Candidatus Marinimicrobia bacterium]|nr:hypothetical protein [Candidatus Neomarinimicrobiota bacterium]MDP6965899.1 hypothetical protein [Candidatus Neomarinimicrobiota bacterium]